MNVTPALLLILDGFGHSTEIADNAIALANKPNWDRLWDQHPHTLITSGRPAGMARSRFRFAT